MDQGNRLRIGGDMERTPFKDPQGRWITTGLFKETAQRKGKYVLFTLDEAKRLYIACGDPTGYLFADEHLGGWQHWLAMKESPVMVGIIAQWEEDLEAKIRAHGILKIVDLSKGDKGYQAAKYIADAGWKPKEMGRPTREKIDRESRIKSKMYDEFKSNVVELNKK